MMSRKWQSGCGRSISPEYGSRLLIVVTGMFELTNESLARLLRGLTIAVGNRRNRILFYQFLAAEIRALHYSYGIGDSESYKRAIAFLQECERLTLRSLVRKSAERHVELTVEHAKGILFRALEKLYASPALAADHIYPEHRTTSDFVNRDVRK